MPNSQLPVLVYRNAGAPSADGFEQLFARHGWGGSWRDGIYDFDHYHSNAHEALGIAAGQCTLQLGGATGESVSLVAGDALVLPAGTGHRRITASDDLLVVGAYPPGQERYDICRDRSPEAELRISKMAVPASDPVLGEDGALLRLWQR